MGGQLGEGQTQTQMNCPMRILALGIGTRNKLSLGNGGTTWAGANPNLCQLSNENFAFGPRNKKQIGSLVLEH